MAIPLMKDDVEVISKLGDTPGSDDGLTTDQLKKKFDLAAVLIKNYINNVLIPNLDLIVDVEALMKEAVDETLSIEGRSADAKAVGDALKMLLPLAGGTMGGAMNMGGFRITNVASPTSGTDAANRNYVTNQISSKYKALNVSVPASGWSATAPYTQKVYASGITSSDRPHYGVVYSSDTETALAEKEAFALIDDLDATSSYVTFTCFEEKPEIDLTIQLEANR